MNRLSPAQKHSLAQCVAYCLLSSAAAAPLLCVYLRRVMFFGLFQADTRRISDEEKANAIVVEYSNRRWSHHDRDYSTVGV